MTAVRLQIRRELRGGKKLILLATAVIAVSAAALVFVLMLANAFETTLRNSAQTLLGGDLALSLSQRDFTTAEHDFITANAAAISHIRTARVLAAAIGGDIAATEDSSRPSPGAAGDSAASNNIAPAEPDRLRIARLKGIDAAYPLIGAFTDIDGNPISTPAGNNAYIGNNLATLLNLKVGDSFTAGALTLQVAGFFAAEPDPNLRFWNAAPPIFIARNLLESGAFTGAEALLTRHIRILLPPNTDAAEWIQNLNAAFPDAGWRVRYPDDAQDNTREIIDNVRRYLALASLAAMLLAGIGCGGALTAFLQARIRGIAVIKMVGGNARFITAVYSSLIALFVIGGALIGAAAGMTFLNAILPLIASYLPFTLAADWSPIIFARALLAVIIMSFAFAIPPVLRFAQINPMTLFVAGNHQDLAPPPRLLQRALMLVTFVVAAAVLPLDLLSKLMLSFFVIVAAILYALALIFAAACEKLMRGRSPGVRLGLQAIARNRLQTAVAVVSFGVGIFILVAITNTERNFYNRIDDTLRQEAPALFLMGARSDQIGAVDAIARANGGTTRMIPYIRGRIVSLGGRAAEDIDPPDEERWVLNGDRGLTWTDGSYIGGSRVTQGKLWDPDITQLQASFDEEAALAFGMQIGDELVLNILGETVTAIVSSFRDIEWQSFDVNFVILLSAPPFADLPHTYMGAAYIDSAAVAPMQLAVSEQLPNILPIDIGAIFEAAKRLLTQSAALIQLTAILLLFCGLPMIFSTLIEHRRRRVQNAAVLRLMGANRGTIIKAGLVEFGGTALIALVPASLLGAFAGKMVIEKLFDLPWQTNYPTIIGVIVIGTLVYLAIGAADISRTAKTPPYPHLRNE